MARLRTVLVTLGAGTAVVAGGTVLATSATATPVPVQAVTAVSADEAGAGSPARAGAGAARWWKQLTDEQRSCLRDADITRPVGPLDDAERAALREQVSTAADACDVELPFARARAFWDGLTDEQRTCLDDRKVTRPWGPLTKEQRQEVRADLAAAAKACGVELPERPRAGSAPSASPSSS